MRIVAHPFRPSYGEDDPAVALPGQSLYPKEPVLHQRIHARTICNTSPVRGHTAQDRNLSLTERENRCL